MSKLYLIPSPLGDNEPAEVLPASVLDIIPNIKCFVVEEIRTARRFLSKAGLKGQIDGLEFHTLNEHSTAADAEALLSLFGKGDVGLISEAGLPAVADPGAALVALCHRHGLEVVPLVGPSSLMLALMGSGLNGQSFAFKGYLPAKSDERRAAIRSMEKLSASLKQSQIIIETPYRNDSLFADLVREMSPSTMLCVAADITLPTQYIKTLPVSQWRKQGAFSIGKRPCVFVVLA
ncbi:MAG: SAM-dependent methyltransferase [Bacteroidales bacterium]|nr:SAM-dependent methyltransferase [Bacteroidales bacterium]